MSFEKELQGVEPVKDTLFTIGVFDGVHLGHQFLLKTLRDRAQARGCLSGVITFKSHPQTVIDPHFRLDWLNDLRDRVALIKSLGIDIVLALRFDENMKQISAHDFMVLLKKHLKLKGLVVGPDFALGKYREGTIEQLRLLGREMDFTVEVVLPFLMNGEVVRSSSIRQTLAQGEVSKVATMLGQPFSIKGIAVTGDRRGRTLGFPTLNLEIQPEMASPSDGVYATITHAGRKTLPSVTNIGERPTFGGGKRLVETHILDYTGTLKVKRLKVDFMERIRAEKRFKDAEELKAQIGLDITQARKILRLAQT